MYTRIKKKKTSISMRNDVQGPKIRFYISYIVYRNIYTYIYYVVVVRAPRIISSNRATASAGYTI